MGRIKALILLSILIQGQIQFASSAFASNTVSFNVPNIMMTAESISDQFRLSIKNKLLQLRQNFIERKFKHGTRFISNQKVSCAFASVDAKMSLVKYFYNQKSIKENGKVASYETRYIQGCEQKNSLIEKIKIIASKERLTSKEDVLKGEFSFSIDKDIELLDYKLLDSEQRQVFRIYIQQKNNTKTTYFYLGREKFIQINYRIIKGKTEIRYKYFPIIFDLNRNGFQYKTNIDPKFAGSFRAIIAPDRSIDYYNDNGEQISLAKFQEIFTLNGMNFIMQSLMIELPATKFVNSGNQSGRLLEELKNAQSWLINGSPVQLNLVKNLVLEYIKAVESGLIVDKRPKDG